MRIYIFWNHFMVIYVQNFGYLKKCLVSIFPIATTHHQMALKSQKSEKIRENKKYIINTKDLLGTHIFFGIILW